PFISHHNLPPRPTLFPYTTLFRSMTNEEIVTQFQQIVETLQRIVNATGDLAARVEQIEDRTAEELGLLTGIQGNSPSSSAVRSRSEEHTSELQSRFDLVCRLLLEK